MPDCDEQKFFAAGSQLGKDLPAPACTPEQLKIPDELRRPPETPIPEPEPDVAPVILVYNRQVTLTCPEVYPGEDIYGDSVTITQGAYSSSYTLAALSKISDDALKYIVSESLLSWTEEYINTTPLGHMSVKTVVKKLHITNAQASQLISETIAIIERLNDLALTNARSQIICYWLNKAQSANCPPGTVEYAAQQEEAEEDRTPTSVVAAGIVTSYLSQADADARALAIAREALICHWDNDEQSASCEVDMGLPDIPNDLYPVYPGLEARVSTAIVAAGSFSIAASTPAEDTLTPEELDALGRKMKEEANLQAKEYALSLLVCYYVNPAMEALCSDSTAGTAVKTEIELTEEEMESDTIVELDKENGTKIRYSLIQQDADYESTPWVKGQRVFVPEGYFVSTVSQEDATERARAIITSLLECCFINRPFEATCPPAQVLDNNGNPAKDEFGNDVYVDADDIPGARLVVEAGTFYSCISQEEADALAEASISGMLVCAYCNGIIPPTCVPSWVVAAATNGIILAIDLEAWKLSDQDEWVKVPMHAGDVFVLDLPLDLKHITNPYTGEDEDTTLWSDDATIGAPAKYNCSSDINVSNQIAELFAVTKLTDGDSKCTYKSKPVIVTCSGNDPFTQCPSCKPSFPHNIEEVPSTAEGYRATSAESVEAFMGWADVVDRTTGKSSVFGSARGNFPWDDVESFPNCASYFVVEEGAYISTVSVDDATDMAKAFAVSMMECVASNPEIYLYCDMDGKKSVSIGTAWHPTPTGYLDTTCKAREGWPHISCTCAAALLDYGHDEDEGVYAAFEDAGLVVHNKVHSDCYVPMSATKLGTVYWDDCGNSSPMYKQYGQDTSAVEYGDFTINGGYPQRIYMEPPLSVDYTTLTMLDPILRDSELDDLQKNIIAQNVVNSKLVEIGVQDGIKRIVPWWAFAKDLGDGKISMYKDGVLPSYVGPAPPYYGVTPEMGLAPGANVMRVKEMPREGLSWSEVVTENNPVIIAARTIQKRNSTSYACWKEARDIGLSMLYCKYAVPCPIIIPDPPIVKIPCCPDPKALNYCKEEHKVSHKEACTGEVTVTKETIHGGSKGGTWGVNVEYTDYSPDAVFYGDTLEEALAKRECFVSTVTRITVDNKLSDVPCLYGNDFLWIVKPCIQPAFRPKNANNYAHWEQRQMSVATNTIISTVSKEDANAKAMALLASLPYPVCIAQNDQIEWETKCASTCTSMKGGSKVIIPEGLLKSKVKTTAELNMDAIAMFDQIMVNDCMAVSQAFSLTCELGEELLDDTFGFASDKIDVTIPEGLVIGPCGANTNLSMTLEAYSMAASMLRCPICNEQINIACTTSTIMYKTHVLYAPDFEEQDPNNITTMNKSGIVAPCTFLCSGAFKLLDPEGFLQDTAGGETSDMESESESGSETNAKARALSEDVVEDGAPTGDTTQTDWSQDPFPGYEPIDFSSLDYSHKTLAGILDEIQKGIEEGMPAADTLGPALKPTCTKEYMNQLAQALGASMAVCVVENDKMMAECQLPSEGDTIELSRGAITMSAEEHTKDEANKTAGDIVAGMTLCDLVNDAMYSPGCGACNEQAATGEEPGKYVATNAPYIPAGNVHQTVPPAVWYYPWDNAEGKELEPAIYRDVHIFDDFFEPMMLACKQMVLSMQVCLSEEIEIEADSTLVVDITVPKYDVVQGFIQVERVVEVQSVPSTVQITLPLTTQTLVQEGTEAIHVDIELPTVSDDKVDIEVPLYTFTQGELGVRVQEYMTAATGRMTYLLSPDSYTNPGLGLYYPKTYPAGTALTSYTTSTNTYHASNVTVGTQVRTLTVNVPMYHIVATQTQTTVEAEIGIPQVEVTTDLVAVPVTVESGSMTIPITITGLPSGASFDTCNPAETEAGKKWLEGKYVLGNN